MLLISNPVFQSTYDFNLNLFFLFHFLLFLISKNMHTFVINLLIFLGTILTFVEVRPISKLEQSLIRQRRQDLPTNNEHVIGDLWNYIQPVLDDHLNSHLSGSIKFGCERKTNDPHITDPGDFVEYCREKILNEDGKTYSTRTNASLHKIDGTIIPLHQAESSIEIETYNQLNY